ncbi:MAG TPA: hypothetical protein VJA16_13190 [Thermoanaerobaculia bacterium]
MKPKAASFGAIAGAALCALGAARPQDPDRVRLVPGLVVVSSQRIALPWGAPVSAARAAGLICGLPTPGDLVPGDPIPIRFACRTSANVAIKIPGSGAGAGSVVSRRATLAIRNIGLSSATLWIDSAADMATARRAIGGLRGARAVEPAVSPPPNPRDREDDYQVGDVGFMLFELGDRPGGFVAVALLRE